MTLCSAVVLVAKGGKFFSNASLYYLKALSSLYLILSLTYFKYSVSVSGVGGKPCYNLLLASSFNLSNSYLIYFFKINQNIYFKNKLIDKI